MVWHLCLAILIAITGIDLLHGTQIDLRLLACAGNHGEDGLVHGHGIVAFRSRHVFVCVVSVLKALWDIQ
jgi:hypothetical protein